MSSQCVSRAELMITFQKLEEQFKQKKADVSSKESDFESARNVLNASLKSSGNEALKSIKEGNHLGDLLQNFISTLSRTEQEWDNRILGREKGTKFRSQFGDSLLVFVYGKVKSGKSSLGNYIAWGSTEPTADYKKLVSPKAKFFSTEQTKVKGGDGKEEAKRNQEFRVGATEATSSIQGFTLPGLTWVDSPGLHSVNAENGDLAQAYVEHADLIIYTMLSQAPGRASDMVEVRSLLEQNKKLLVLLTRSDAEEEDTDENDEIVKTTVMKSESNRKKQVEYVTKELEKLSGKTNVLAEVLPISTCFAERNATDLVAFADSGMGRLFADLQLISTEHGLQIKLETPMNNLKNFIAEVQQSTQPLKMLLTDFRMQIQKQQSESLLSINEAQLAAERDMNCKITKLFSTQDHSTIDSKSLEYQLCSQFIQTVNTQVDAALEKLGRQLEKNLNEVFDSSAFARLPEFEEFTEDRKFFKIRKGTKRWWEAGLTIVGTIAGAFVAGPAGAVGGGTIGGLLGNGIGGKAKAEYGTQTVKVGDNTTVIQQTAMNSYSGHVIKDYVQNSLNQQLEPVFASMINFINSATMHLERFEQSLRNI